MNYNMKQSGERIRQLRLKSGLTQEQIAGQLNIDRSFYGRVEAGKSGCSVDLLIQLSDLFEVSLDYLILGRYSMGTFKDKEKLLLKEDIRTETDTCVVTILDERAVPGQRHYEAMRAALPEMQVTDSLEDVVEFIYRVKGPDYFKEGSGQTEETAQ